MSSIATLRMSTPVSIKMNTASICLMRRQESILLGLSSLEVRNRFQSKYRSRSDVFITRFHHGPPLPELFQADLRPLGDGRKCRGGDSNRQASLLTYPTIDTAQEGAARYDGQVFVLMVITVAAAEVAVGLGILIAMFRNRDSVDLEEVSLLKW